MAAKNDDLQKLLLICITKIDNLETLLHRGTGDMSYFANERRGGEERLEQWHLETQKKVDKIMEHLGIDRESESIKEAMGDWPPPRECDKQEPDQDL